jgi:hypothetical protein
MWKKLEKVEIFGLKHTFLIEEGKATLVELGERDV